MSDSKSFRTRTSNDSDGHSDKTVGKEATRAENGGDSASSSADRAVENTVVLGDGSKAAAHTEKGSTDRTTRGRSAGPDRSDRDIMQTVPIDPAWRTGELKPEPGVPAEEPKPDQTAVLGEEPRVAPPEADKPADGPSGSHEAVDPMQTMVMDELNELRDLLSDKARTEKVEDRRQTVSLDRDPPPTGPDTNDPNQTMVIGGQDDLRGLVSGTGPIDELRPQKTVSLDRDPPRSDNRQPARSDTLSLDKSRQTPADSTTRGRDVTSTTPLGRPTETPAQDGGTRTMPIDAGNKPPPSGSSSRDGSQTMVLGSAGKSPPSTRAPQDPPSKTVVLGGHGQEKPPSDGGVTEHRTVPLDGSRPSPQRSGTPTTVLGRDPGATASDDADTKTVVLGHNQSPSRQQADVRTVPLSELGSNAEHNKQVSERAITEPVIPSLGHAANSPIGNTGPVLTPDGTGRQAWPAHSQGATQGPPLRASSFDPAPRSGETQDRVQLLRSTTSALAFAVLAIVISILCAALSPTAVSLTYTCSVVALCVGIFSFWRYMRLLRQLAG